MTDLKEITKKLKLVLSEMISESDLDPVLDYLANQWYADNAKAFEEGLAQGFSLGFNL